MTQERQEYPVPGAKQHDGGLNETASDVVTTRRHGSVGVLVIDNPPVNASSSAVRAGLLRGVADLSSDHGIEAIVLIGATQNFVSGSDLKEFASPVIPQPELPQVINAIRDAHVPVIAAISGATLGGGLELALGCDYRIAQEDTVLGLPETTLGMIPGAGGTQFSLHLLGAEGALELITSGSRFPVTDARVRDLVDSVVEAPVSGGGLEAAAVAFAREVQGKRDVRTLPIPDSIPGAIEEAACSAIRTGRGRPQTIAAVGAVLAGLALDVDTALDHERNEFTRLRNGEESAALRHVFFARRAAAKANRPQHPVTLERVAIVGSGTMGRGIARAFLDHGMAVMLHDERPEALDSARDHLDSAYQTMAERGQITADQAASRLDRLQIVPALADLGGADLYIEAVFEDLAVKSTVLRGLEEIAAGAVVASNTSYLDINALAGELSAPERFLGLHFFSPAHRTSIVEVVRGDQTGTEALDMAFTAAKALGKDAIRSAVCEGFIGNRIYNAYRRQCELMLEEGALPQQVDAAMRRFGFAMGPFAVADMAGLDIAWRMRQRTAAQRDPAERYPDVADQLCEQGRFGQKSGRGWYAYGKDGRTPIPDPEVEALIIDSSRRKGRDRTTFTPEQIMRRAVLAMANEAALILVEGVADRASDIDVMMVLGYGFPDFRGGPTLWARQQDADALAQELDALERVSGHGFRRGDLSLLDR